MKKLAVILLLLILGAATSAHAHEPDFYSDVPVELRGPLEDWITQPYIFIDGFRDEANGEVKAILLLQQVGKYYIFILSLEPDGWQCEVVSSPLPSLGAVPHLVGWCNYFWITYEYEKDEETYKLIYYFLPQEDGAWWLDEFSYRREHAKGTQYFTADFSRHSMYLTHFAPQGNQMVQDSLDTFFGVFDLDLRTLVYPVSEQDVRSAYSMEGYAMINNPNRDDRLNLREKPSQDSASLGKYYNRTMVEIIEELTNGWVAVDIQGAQGYVMKEYLAFGEAAKLVEGTALTLDMYIVNPPGDTLPLYTKPDLDSDIAYRLPENADIYVLGDIGDTWCHVQYGNVTGYVETKFLVRGHG